MSFLRARHPREPSGKGEPFSRERKAVDILLDTAASACKFWNSKIYKTGLHTPTFEALLKADGTLWLSGVALREGFSVEAVQALTRFLSERVKLPPTEPPYEFEDFTPRWVEE